RNFLKISRRDNSLIDAFKAAADEHDALARSKRARTRLGKDSAAGRKQQARAIVVLVKRGIEACSQHVGAQYHSGTHARRRVVTRSITPAPMQADVAPLEAPNAACQSPSRKRRTKRPRQHLRTQGQDGCVPHGQHSGRASLSSISVGGRTVKWPASRS